MVEKRNIFIIGPMGSGKSTVGKFLSQKLKMDFFDSDQEIEKRAGVDLRWIFDVEGEKGLREREERIIEELTKKNGIILSTGGGSVVSPKTRKNLSSRGIVIYLNISVKEQFLRIQQDKKRKILSSKQGNYSMLMSVSNHRISLYEEISDINICVNRKNVKSIVNEIFDFLEK